MIIERLNKPEKQSPSHSFQCQSQSQPTQTYTAVNKTNRNELPKEAKNSRKIKSMIMRRQSKPENKVLSHSL
jgi:hypothetical protein